MRRSRASRAPTVFLAATMATTLPYPAGSPSPNKLDFRSAQIERSEGQLPDWVDIDCISNAITLITQTPVTVSVPPYLPNGREAVQFVSANGNGREVRVRLDSDLDRDITRIELDEAPSESDLRAQYNISTRVTISDVTTTAGEVTIDRKFHAGRDAPPEMTFGVIARYRLLSDAVGRCEGGTGGPAVPSLDL